MTTFTLQELGRISNFCSHPMRNTVTWQHLGKVTKFKYHKKSLRINDVKAKKIRKLKIQVFKNLKTFFFGENIPIFKNTKKDNVAKNKFKQNQRKKFIIIKTNNNELNIFNITNKLSVYNQKFDTNGHYE